ncbi:MAG: type 1 glutamine amidotransferase, partial [Pseudomonadota bacterium]
AAKAPVSSVAPAEQYARALKRFAPDLETAIARPFFDAADIETDLDGIDGVALTGSGVAWSADAPEAAPHRRLVERVFAAGIPVIGSCWGLQIGAVILGGGVGISPRGLEVPVARAVRLTEAGRAHPMHAGRGAVFDVPCIHRDEVTVVPTGAVVTAANDHAAVQAMIYERGGVRFWGVQYHPEHGADVALGYLLSRNGDDITGGTVPAAARDILDDPEFDLTTLADATGEAALARSRQSGVGAEVFCPHRRGRELAAWLMSIDSAAHVATAPRLRAFEPASGGLSLGSSDPG